MKKFQIAGKRASESPAENFGAWKKIFGAGNFFFGARIFLSRRQDFGAGLPQKVKAPHKTLHKGAVLCKKCLVFSLFCLAGSKAVSRESTKIRQKETCSVFGMTFCQTRVSSDTVPSSAATGSHAHGNNTGLERKECGLFRKLQTIRFQCNRNPPVKIQNLGAEEVFVFGLYAVRQGFHPIGTHLVVFRGIGFSIGIFLFHQPE